MSDVCWDLSRSCSWLTRDVWRPHTRKPLPGRMTVGLGGTLTHLDGVVLTEG